MSRVWRRLSREEPTDYKIFGVRREQYESPRTGQALNATIVEAPDWVNVIALTPEEQCVLVRQYRFGTERVALEIPGGMIDPDESPLLAAERELREETGYGAQRLDVLGRVAPNPAFQRNYLYTYLAEGCVCLGGSRARLWRGHRSHPAAGKRDPQPDRVGRDRPRARCRGVSQARLHAAQASEADLTSA